MNEGLLPNGRKILPDNWLAAASDWTRAINSVTAAQPDGTYGYQWWHNGVAANACNVSPHSGLNPSRTLWGIGIFGQLIVIDPSNKLVIVQWATWPEAEPSFTKQPLEASLMFNAIANELEQ